ncbi:MAG: hypothetical protein ACXWQR_07350 [Ktedonobacterales bacterium]
MPDLIVRDGKVLVIFSEAYPNIHPVFTLKSGTDAVLPFRSGVIRLVELAERDDTPHVQIVPDGFAYQRDDQRLRCLLRLGPPLSFAAACDKATLLRTIDERGYTPSAPLPPCAIPRPQQSQQAYQA